MPLARKEEGKSSLVGAYAYGFAVATFAVGSIWFYRFWSDMYDKTFPRDTK